MSELFDKGLKVRKEVLGEDYVNKSIAGADEFTRTMAEWSTEFCWGALWTRPGLDRRTRSIVNLAMLGALNRPHELKLHVKGALKNGVTKDEIKEILLAGCRVLRRARRHRCVPQRARGAQRSRIRSSEEPGVRRSHGRAGIRTLRHPLCDPRGAAQRSFHRRRPA